MDAILTKEVNVGVLATDHDHPLFIKGLSVANALEIGRKREGLLSRTVLQPWRVARLYGGCH